MDTHKIMLWGSQAEVDLEATKNWYRSAEEWGCACGHCKNFLELARQKKFPDSMLQVLNTFHIPPEKATYVGQLYSDDAGHHYQCSYRIAGNILTEGTEAIMEARCCHEIYPYGAPGFPEPHFDLEFYLTLPWVLDEPDE